MKKMNVLAAVVAVLAAASVAGAQEIEVDFDGAKKGFQAQSMHDIFSGSHQIIPQEALSPAPVPANPKHIPPNAISSYCEEMELAPGIHLPLCFVGDAVALTRSSPGIIHEIGNGLKQAHPNYSSRPGFTAAMKKLSGDKSMKILYNGKTVVFARNSYINKIDDWDHTDIYTPVTDAVDSLPNNGTFTSIGAAGGAVSGASGGLVGSVLGAIGGAIIGFAADLAS